MGHSSFRYVILFFMNIWPLVLPLPSEDRIVGGAHIDIVKVPYMLSYMVNGQHVCGASIIDPSWGLTAAHCVIPFKGRPALTQVRSGSVRHDSGGVIHNVTKQIIHQNYNDDTNDCDIALFKVNPPFKFNNSTQPAKLPYDSASPEWGLVAGWGYFLNFDPVLSETLQYVILPRVDKETCIKDYKGSFAVTSHQICYGLAEGGKDSCKGDSGGALTYNGIVYGITSWGDKCGEARSPGVYTKVTSFVRWIMNHIKAP